MTPATRSTRTILNVNDESTPRYVLSHTLRAHGFTVVESLDATTAEELVRIHQPDLVLLDVLLPDLNGLALCSQLKQQHPFLAILMVSAYYTAEEDYTAALQKGADAYLMLPASPSRLLAIVETVLKIHDLYREQLTLERQSVERLEAEVQRLHDVNRELEEKLAILQEFENVVVGRELKMIELKTQLQHVQHKLNTSQEEIRQEERRRLGLGLHDSVGQVLAVAKLQLGRLQQRINAMADDAQRTSLHGIVESLMPDIESALTKVRDVSLDLQDSAAMEASIARALESEGLEFERRFGLRCDRRVDDIDLDQEAIRLVVLICREALTNVGRHAAATEARVHLRRSGRRIMLTVSDNGKGIAPSETHGRHTLGIQGMHERARGLGGRVTIEGHPGHGTTVTLSFRSHRGQEQGTTND